MVLEPEEVEQFYRVWFPLLYYVNQQRKLLKSFPASWQALDKAIAPSKVFKLRNALWADDALREAFIEQNPAGLAPDDLALVASWKHRIEGRFFVFRYLKKYAVFLSDHSPVRAYGVLGLVSSIEEVVGGPYLPVYVEAVLLPFKNRIVYDSLIAPFPVAFGSGIQAELAHSYRLAQEGTGIITSLQPGFERRGQSSGVRHKKVLAAFQSELRQAGLTPKMITEHAGNIEAFAQGERFNSDPAHSLLELDRRDVDTYLRRPGANPVSLKRFIVFLRDTDRLDYVDAQALLAALKRRRGGS